MPNEELRYEFISRHPKRFLSLPMNPYELKLMLRPGTIAISQTCAFKAYQDVLYLYDSDICI